MKSSLVIDICVSVIDNLGDIGFLTELLISLKRAGIDANFCIYTDETGKVREFLDLNRHLLPRYSVGDIGQYGQNIPAPILFLLFHFPIPHTLPSRVKAVFRIDYLSFDPSWVQYHLSEHIASTQIRKVFEIIPSPLPSGAGLLGYIGDTTLRREQLCYKYRFPESLREKKWITLFCYDTLFERIDFKGLEDDVCVMILGRKTTNVPILERGISENIFFLPLLPLDEFQSLMALSDANIVRGEVSVVTALHTGKPFLWDMYKGRGGFPEAMSQDFLAYFAQGQEYGAWHHRINQSTDRISFSELIDFLQKQKPIRMLPEDLGENLKKYIDRFYFSL